MGAQPWTWARREDLSLASTELTSVSARAGPRVLSLYRPLPPRTCSTSFSTPPRLTELMETMPSLTSSRPCDSINSTRSLAIKTASVSGLNSLILSTMISPASPRNPATQPVTSRPQGRRQLFARSSTSASLHHAPTTELPSRLLGRVQRDKPGSSRLSPRRDHMTCLTQDFG